MHLQTFFLQAAVKQKKFVLIQMVDTLRRSVRARYNTDKDLKKKKKKKLCMIQMYSNKIKE